MIALLLEETAPTAPSTSVQFWSAESVQFTPATYNHTVSIKDRPKVPQPNLPRRYMHRPGGTKEAQSFAGSATHPQESGKIAATPKGLISMPS